MTFGRRDVSHRRAPRFVRPGYIGFKDNVVIKKTPSMSGVFFTIGAIVGTLTRQCGFVQMTPTKLAIGVGKHRS